MNALRETGIAGRRVVLGLSGGVDSAVAALCLKEAGADVQALHMTNWDDDDGYCTAAGDLQDARVVCEQLDIPLHHVNFAREYREQVFSHFLSEYRHGRTPNPDVLCNREIKFGQFRRYAERLGADCIATGHYARLVPGSAGPQLLRGADRNKDQSYFLHAVPGAAFEGVVFPLGELEKDEVRNIARDAGLAVAGKKDSTGICFIGERPFRQFLSAYLPARPGPMCTPEGVTVGQHEGLMYYTFGQRQGLGIGGRQDGGGEPWYVAGKNVDANRLIVVQGDHPSLYSSAVEVGPANWIGINPLDLASEFDCTAKLRYRQPDQACTVRVHGDGQLHVEFERAQRAVAPGQFAVFYAGQRCLGGGVIKSTVAAGSRLQQAV